MFPHGAQKALGWFGGPGIAGTVGDFGQLGIPVALVYLVIAVEVLGPILLVAGVLTRLVALGLAIDLAVAAILVHLPNGFFLNFTGKQAGEGIEFHLLFVGAALALTIGGPGRIALMKKI
jgi:putative oxidoreductase